MAKVAIGFGIRGVQPGDENYPHSSGGVISFAFEVEGDVTTKGGAEAAFGFHRQAFYQWLKDGGISCRDQLLPPDDDGIRRDWIPTCYLEQPHSIEVDGVLLYDHRH